MDRVVQHLVDLSECRNIPADLGSELSREAIRLFAMRVLGWLRDHARPTRRDPFRPVPTGVARFIELLPDVGRLVVVTGGHLDFHPGLTEGERTQLARAAMTHYEPSFSVMWLPPPRRVPASNGTCADLPTPGGAGAQGPKCGQEKGSSQEKGSETV
jgi:hypothetical protein